VGGVKLKLKLNSAQLKLEFGLSLAIIISKHVLLFRHVGNTRTGEEIRTK
jgi:hypothetical protein